MSDTDQRPPEAGAEKLPRTNSFGAIAAALSKAQGKFKAPKKTKTAKIMTRQGADRSYKYSDLAELIEAVREPLADNELCYTQLLETSPNNAFRMVTLLLHSSGEQLRTTYPLPSNVSAHETGSAITYARRYSLGCILGVASEDDDDGGLANDASKNGAAAGGKAPVEPGTKPPVAPKGEEKAKAAAQEKSDPLAPALIHDRKEITEIILCAFKKTPESAKAMAKRITGKMTTKEWTMADVAALRTALAKEFFALVKNDLEMNEEMVHAWFAPIVKDPNCQKWTLTTYNSLRECLDLAKKELRPPREGDFDA